VAKYYSSTIAGGKISNDTTVSERIVNTPSPIAKKMLNFVQEMGTLTCKRSHLSARSRLNSYLIIIILRGSGTITYNKKDVAVKSGDLVFIDCNTEYSHCCNMDDPWEFTWLHFNGPQAAMIHSYFLKRNGSILLRPIDISPYLAQLHKLFTIMAQKNRDYEIIASSQINILFTSILTETGNTNQQSNTNEKMYLIKEYLEKNINGKITLDTLSAEFCISKYYMTRQFKDLFGTTIVQYLTFCRINHSKKLLRFTSMPVAEIATECGFEDACYFNKVFHETEGMTAGKYRKLWDTKNK